jgi:hypothetical protein
VIRCACGLEHADASALVKRGWQVIETTGYLMVNCTCASTIVAETREDVCLCSQCRGVITGQDGDIKVCQERDDGPPRIVCHWCQRREGVGIAEVAHARLLPRRFRASEARR